MKKSIVAMIRMKQSLKQAIKAWLTDFEERHMRPPTKEEKTQIHDKYMAYAMMNKHLAGLEEESNKVDKDLKSA